MNPIDILNKFIIQELDGDVFLLLDYDLKRLKNNAVLGCPNRRFDPDDTNLMRAVCCIVFGDVWTNLSLETLEMENCVVIQLIQAQLSSLILGTISSHQNGNHQ